MTRKSEWTGMSPGSSDSARGSSSHRWDSQSSSYSSLKGDHHLQEEDSFVDDKETASSAVAFVVHSSRKGIIHLCADVANLIKAKKRLEHLVKTLKEENAQLRQVTASHRVSCGHTSRSSTPSPPSVDSSDSHYHYPRGRRKGSLLSGSARHRGISPSLSTSTLTSPGEELGPSSREGGRRAPSRRRQTSTPQRAGLTQEKETAVDEPVHNCIQNGTVRGEGGAESDFEEDNAPPLGNRHQVTVEVHQSPDSEMDLGTTTKSEEEDVTVVMESVGVQCSLCVDVHSELQRQIEEVEKQKTELENSYVKIQDELEQLNRHVETLEKDKRMKDQCTVEIENELSRRNIPQTKSLVKFNDPAQLLPRLTEQTSTNQKTVNSMSRITGGCTFHLGDRVVVKGDRTGRVRYIGPLKHLNQTMMFAGVQLDSAAGRHDGSVHGHHYFSCPKNHGVFVPVQDVHTVMISKSSKRSKSAKPLSSFPRNPSTSRNKRITPVLPSTSVKSESLPSRPASSKSQTWFHK